MKKLIVCSLIVAMLLTGVSYSSEGASKPVEEGVKLPEISLAAVEISDISSSMSAEVSPEPQSLDSPLTSEEPVFVTEESAVSDEEVELLALLTMAEAEGESEYGQRLVIDVVLNRVDSPYFPNDIYSVIWQKNQFSPMRNGRVKVCYIKEELVQLVREEMESRTDWNVIFFRTKRYHNCGVPMFQVGAHYFSSYD